MTDWTAREIRGAMTAYLQDPRSIEEVHAHLSEVDMDIVDQIFETLVKLGRVVIADPAKMLWQVRHS